MPGPKTLSQDRHERLPGVPAAGSPVGASRAGVGGYAFGRAGAGQDQLFGVFGVGAGKLATWGAQGMSGPSKSNQNPFCSKIIG